MIAITPVTLAATASVVELQKGSAVPPPQATASDAKGDYAVVWTSNTVGAAGVYAKVYQANWSTVPNTTNGHQANPPANPTEIYVTTNSTATYASVACDAAGDFVVTWSEQDAGDWNVWASEYGANGKLLLAPFMVNTTTTDVQEYSAVGMDADGDFVITWQSLNQDGSGWGVYAQRYDSAGNPVGGQDDAQLMTFVGQPRGTFTLYWNNGGPGSHRDRAISYQGNGAATATAIQTELATIGATVKATAISGTQILIEFVGAQADQDQPQIVVQIRRLQAPRAPRSTLRPPSTGLPASSA